MTVRELVQMLLLNCNLDDTIEVEYKVPLDEKEESFSFRHDKPRRVIHFPGGEALIECHDE